MVRDDLERRRRRVATLFTLAVLAVWIVVGIVEPPYLLPGPGTVLERLGAFVIDPHMWVHAGASLMHVVVAVAGSMVIGGFLALLAYYLPVFRLAVHGRISPFLNSFSGTGWVLLAVLWFGLGDFTVVFSLAMVLIPFAIINVRHGLDSLDPELIEMAKSFGHSGFKRFRLIILPALTPFLFSTMRSSFGVSWKALLTAELFGGDKGFGRLFNVARQNYDTPLVVTVIVIIVIAVYASDRYLFEPAQARLSAHYEAL
jgi:NitT/TauT family transport system permease protein/sulfonate transport system permease protein